MKEALIFFLRIRGKANQLYFPYAKFNIPFDRLDKSQQKICLQVLNANIYIVKAPHEKRKKYSLMKDCQTVTIQFIFFPL